MTACPQKANHCLKGPRQEPGAMSLRNRSWTQQVHDVTLTFGGCYVRLRPSGLKCVACRVRKLSHSKNILKPRGSMYPRRYLELLLDPISPPRSHLRRKLLGPSKGHGTRPEARSPWRSCVPRGSLPSADMAVTSREVLEKLRLWTQMSHN